MIFTKTIVKELPCPHTAFLEKIKKGSQNHLEEMAETERKEHVTKISLIYQEKAFHKELDALIETIVYAMAKEFSGDLQHEFGKGTINGIEKIREWFLQLHNEHLANSREKDIFDKHGLIAE